MSSYCVSVKEMVIYLTYQLCKGDWLTFFFFPFFLSFFLSFFFFCMTVLQILFSALNFFGSDLVYLRSGLLRHSGCS
jgi:hypothetical protein